MVPPSHSFFDTHVPVSLETHVSCHGYSIVCTPEELEGQRLEVNPCRHPPSLSRIPSSLTHKRFAALVPILRSPSESPQNTLSKWLFLSIHTGKYFGFATRRVWCRRRTRPPLFPRPIPCNRNSTRCTLTSCGDVVLRCRFQVSIRPWCYKFDATLQPDHYGIFGFLSFHFAIAQALPYASGLDLAQRIIHV